MAAMIEAQRCNNYVQLAERETLLVRWWREAEPDATLFVAQGFEERGFGVLSKLAEAGIRIPKIVIGRYSSADVDNDRFATEYDTLSRSVARKVSIIDNEDDGSWVGEGLASIETKDAILDISGLSNRGLFGALDALRQAPCRTALAYSEAGSYWPTRSAWSTFKREFSREEQAELGTEFDLQPYLYGGDHRVVLLPHHEGYDTPGAKLALVGFLPFKAGRLAAILSWTEYAKYVLIAGQPRLKSNSWRLGVLKAVNARQIYGRKVFEIPTFGYLSCLRQLMALLEAEQILEECDVHLSPMGSKLQNVACWILSTLIPSLTVLLSIPRTYYPKAYSDGTGRSWAFRFCQSDAIGQESLESRLSVSHAATV